MLDMMDLGRFYGFYNVNRTANWMAIIESGTSNGRLGMGRLKRWLGRSRTENTRVELYTLVFCNMRLTIATDFRHSAQLSTDQNARYDIEM
jgi:hypothetical protein